MAITVEKKNIKTIYSDFWFSIPAYQRPYVWEKEDVNNLLEDLWFASENIPNDEYFLGSLVLQKTQQVSFNEYEVIDGQQRLTTILILMAVLRDIIVDSDNQTAQTCHNRIIQQENKADGIPERQRIIYKIRDDVEKFVAEFILTAQGTTEEKELEKYSKSKNTSIAHMANAILAMRAFFTNDKKTKLFAFVCYVGLNTVFIYVSTNGGDDAIRLFNILSNRGIPLTSADILKSTNIDAIKTDIDKYAEKWEEMEGYFGDDFDRFLSIVRTMFVKEKARLDLLKEFDENIYKPNLLKKGKDTIDCLVAAKEAYDKIINLSNTALSNEYANLITIMKVGLPSNDWVAPVLAFYKKFGDINLLEFLKKLEHKFTGDWILQYMPTQRINNMNEILKEIERCGDAQDVLAKKSLYEVSADKIRDGLDSEIYGKSFAKYILLKYEYLLSSHSTRLSNYTKISIEHVLPQNPEKESEWMRNFTDNERETWTHKLANLVLISGNKNSTLSNLDFEDKKERYLFKAEKGKKSGGIDPFASSKIFATHKKWDVSKLEERQKSMLDELITNC